MKPDDAPVAQDLIAPLQEILSPDYLQENDILNLLPAAVYICDMSGVIKKYNEHAVKLWGRRPVPGDKDERFCGSYKLYNPDGSYLPHNQTPVAACLEDGLPRKDQEVIIEKPDHSRLHVRMNIVPVKDSQGKQVGMINCFYDITDQKKTERELKRKTKELQDYVDNAAIGLHWVDANGIIKWANKAELEMLGYTEEEYIGHHISEFHIKQEKINDLLLRLNCNETLDQYESELRCKDGSIKTVHISSNVFWENGNFIHTRCFTVDITEKKKLFNALRENEEGQRRILKDLPAAIYSCDTKGYITFYNDAATELWGREPEIGKDLWCGSWKINQTDGSPLPLDTCPMAICLKESRPVYGEEIIVVRPDGELRNVLPHPQPVFDSNGKMIGAVNMLMDITKLKKAEQTIRESEERFKIAANAAPVLIWMSDKNKNRYFFNKGWLEYTGRTHEQEVGIGWTENVHLDDLKMLLDIYHSSFEKQKEYKLEYRLRRHDGEYRWILSHGIPRYSPDKKFEGFIGTCIDIHDKKMMTEALEREVSERTKDLKEANQQLLHYNEQLEEFAYAASHDMKEPLRKILFYNNHLWETAGAKLGEKEKEYLNRSINAAKRMASLIDDLLEYSKANSDSQNFELADVNEIIDEIILSHKDVIDQDKVLVHFHSLPTIKAIPFQLRQLFDNLITNALKYRHPERQLEITIMADMVTGENIAELDKEKNYCKISVCDNGVGFDDEYSEKIFELFQRLGAIKCSGTGVGLALCKKIAQNHNGIIKAKGKTNEGACFEIYLPV
jgi:PAS domain S-box-containing protein